MGQEWDWGREQECDRDGMVVLIGVGLGWRWDLGWEWEYDRDGMALGLIQMGMELG